MSERLTPGLLILHGNRLEQLAEAVFAWLREHPLPPLEPETFLVQSNGMAEWLKMELAGALGICAATRVELPARFVWRAYREVLGRAAVPQVSALDKLPLTWRLMRLLPVLAARPGFEPVAAFLDAADGSGVEARRLQLARRLADLFDAYQVYRGDWLADWSHGHEVLRRDAAQGVADAPPVPGGQRWQPALWRAVLEDLPPEWRAASRAQLHRRFLQALDAGAGGRDAGARPAAGGPGALPSRIVLFGTTHIPLQMLEAVAALASRCQVMVAVPNPCRHYWADLIDGRELLRAQRRRHAPRGGRDLSAVPLQDLHAHGHPLLAAWGRQSRDFVRLLDAFDDVQAARRRFAVPRVDLFDETPARSWLQQVQAAIRELQPLAEHPRGGLADDDRSIVFHVAHGAQREVEILHDQLLHLLAHPPEGRPLNPRDIVVMVPDIETFAPAIRSVFGQHPRGHPRHVPWGIADQRERGRQPLLVALEWLLRLPRQRVGASELRDLLDVPAVARRLGIDPAERPTLVAWIDGSGIRWGLDAQHRAGLELAAGGDQNSWAFGLRRMLLGYATGELPDAAGHAGIEPYPEVAGLSAALAGSLAEALQLLTDWSRDAQAARTPMAWVERLRGLVAALFEPVDDADRAMLAALEEALAAWLQACEAASFDDPVELAVVREAWLDALDQPGVSRRFKAGGVTFCTLLPLRAIPFEVVCLLGLNDGDYPRPAPRSDVDLMALPRQARPGDRSRRDDDRQLMLDALLSARRVLYVSWTGRSARDNEPRPPSVLVSQLRDYLQAGWGQGVLGLRTTEHPLQPFSRRYFEPGDDTPPPAGDDRDAARGPLFTYAGEWRAAHDATPGGEPGQTQAHGPAVSAAAGEASSDAAGATSSGPEPPAARAAAPGSEPAPLRLDVQRIAGFLRNPVRAFFRERLQVVFDEQDGELADEEPFESAGLEHWALLDELLRACRRRAEAEAARAPLPAGRLERIAALEIARVQRAGRLPLAGPGRQAQAELAGTLLPMLLGWQAAIGAHGEALEPRSLQLVDPLDHGLVFDDVLAGLRAGIDGALPLWIDLQAGAIAVTAKNGRTAVPREDKLLVAWVRCLAAAACGCPARGLLIGRGASVEVAPPPAEAARQALVGLMRACRDGLRGPSPLPTAVRTGLAWLTDAARARTVYDGAPGANTLHEGRDPCLARLYPDFATLAGDPAFAAATQRLYAPLREWIAAEVRAQPLPGAMAEGGDAGPLPGSGAGDD